MLASFLRGSDIYARGALNRGFSLLELLVVLALISFMTALVAPRLKNTVDAISRSGDREAAARQLERLPLLARRDGAPIGIVKGQELIVTGLEFPRGWRARAIEELHVAANGYCSPALLEMNTPAGRERWVLGTPDCRVSNGP